MENLIRGVNQECFESCVLTLCVLVLGQGMRYSNDTASLLPQLTPRQPYLAGLSYHWLMQPSGSQYLHKSCSLSPLAL